MIAFPSFLMALGIIAGAFGAHGLEAHITPERLDVWKTGVLYHLLHAFALLLLPILAQLELVKAGTSKIVGRIFTFGILVFSGSLYLLVLTDTGWLGAITPIGGSALIIGWIYLAANQKTRF